MKPLLCCLWAGMLCTGVAMAQDKMLEPYTGTAADSPFQQDQTETGLPLDDQFVDAITRAPCAGDVDINGAGTAGWGYSINTYWHDRRSTTIYLASEFNCSNGGQIVGIKYYVSVVPGLPMTDLTIRLRHTTATSYSSPYCFTTTGWTICYEANTTISTTGWYTFTFTTPFTYNGVENLEVDFSFNNSAYSGQGTIWSFTGTGNRSIYAYCDSCNGDPKNWTCGSPNPTVYASTGVPRAKFVFPGGGPTGACCKPDGSCLPGLTQPECAAQGGNWMGEGTTCTPNNCPQPPVRCCLPDGACLMVPAPDCTLMGGVPGPYGSTCDPIASYVTIPCTSPFEDISGTGIHVPAAEVDDGGAAVPIGFTFTFYGVPMTSIGVTSNGYLTFGTTYGDYSPDPIPSTSLPNDLIAVLWRDLNATGHSVQYQTFGAAPNRWFIAQWTNVPCYSGCGPNTFQAVLYEADGCIELRYLLLDPAVSGYKAGVENSTGTIGVDVTGMVAMGACIRLCPGMLPPCPQPGACCFLDGSCQFVTLTACNAAYGIFHGEGTLCDPNPCPPPCVECPPEGIPEGEPDCGPNYVDNFNGGCNSSPNVFSPVQCGQTICGEGGTYLFGTTQRRDTDWYEVVTTAPTVFTWTVTATFPALVGLIEQIVPGVPGCANITGYVNPAFTTVACQPGGVTTVCLPAGTYYFFVATSAFAGIPCGSPYVAMLTCAPCPVGACCLTDGQCLPDLNQVDCAAMGGAWQGAGTLCDPNPCIGACCFLDGLCLVVSPAECSAGGGTYLGGGTNCDLNPCPQPGPDTCDLAQLLLVPGSIYGHNRLATDDNPPYCGTSAPYKNVWYKTIGTGNTITVTTCSLKTLFDTKIQVFCDCPAVTCVVGNDDSCSLSGHSLNSTVSFCSALGSTYYITVGSYSSTTVGDFELIVTDDGVPCSNPACPQPTGACCVGTLCLPDLTEAACTAQGGIWQGAGTHCFPSPCLPPPDYYIDPVGAQGGNGYQNTWYVYPNFNWINMWWPNEFALDRHKIIHVSLDVWFPQGGVVVIALNWDTPAWTQQGLARPPLPADVPTPELENLYIGRQVLETITSDMVPPYPQFGHFDFVFELPFCPDWISMDVQGNGYQVEGTIVHICLPAANGACCFPGSICQVTTAEQCLAVGGTFKGAGTVCDPNPCICLGDVNCDGVVNFGDINPFVLMLSNFTLWQQTYPGCPWQNGDINGNGSVGFEDINPFVALIVQSPFVCQY